MHRLRCLACFALLFSLAPLVGCTGKSGPTLTPVKGTVTVEKKPVAGVRVLFVPELGTTGQGGEGIADDLGQYEIAAYPKRDAKGLPPGTYRVILTRKVLPDGTVAPPNTKWADSPARETVAAPYSSRNDTPLTVVVEAEPKDLNFSLPAGTMQ